MKQLTLTGEPAPRTLAEFKRHAFDRWAEEHEGLEPTWGKLDYIQLAKLFKACGQAAFKVWDVFLTQTGQYYEGYPPGKCFKERDRFRSMERVNPAPTRRAEKLPATMERARQDFLKRQRLERKRVLEEAARLQEADPSLTAIEAQRAIQRNPNALAEKIRKRVLAEDPEQPTLTKEMVAQLKQSIRQE